MKKFLILVLLLAVGLVSKSWADTVSDDGAWFIQINGDSGFPTGNLANNVNQGWGGEGSIGYHFAHDYAVAVESGFDTYSAKGGANAQWNMVPLIFKVQMGGYSAGVSPYLLLGAGVAFNSETATVFGITGNASETDFLGEAGLGLAFPLSDKANFFVQGKVEADMTSSNYSKDQPTVLIPINAGFQFLM
jgi:hypothetical protein